MSQIEKPWGPQQPSWGAIKQVQLLMVLLSSLPDDGKLREILGKALAVPQREAMAGVTPLAQVSVDGLRAWLTTIWSGELSPAMRALVDWQLKSDNVKGAVQELDEAQNRLGFTLSIVRRD
jgi:hypothetical protein